MPQWSSAEPRGEALAIRPGKSYKVVRNKKQAVTSSQPDSQTASAGDI
jgi:hypothetical protein